MYCYGCCSSPHQHPLNPCRRRDEDLAQQVDNITRQITRKQEELRMKRQQVTQNAATVESLYAQVCVT